jgi:hypothetical protein
VLFVSFMLAAPALAKEMPGAKDLLETRIAELDGHIAKRMLRLPDTPTEKKPRLDMEIDLRIVARWFFAQAAGQKEANDVQVVGRLRGELALEAVAGVEEVLNQQREKLTLGQVEGMKRLHELSFKLADAKGAASLDETSRQLATAAVMIAGPGAPDARSLPSMRPKVSQSERTSSPAAERSDVVNVPAIADKVPSLNVSVPLRQQLSLLVAAALNEKEKDPAAVAKTLSVAFELAVALQNNVAVVPDARVQMESRLAEGIALFLDPRTRGAGRNRISELNEYRKIVERIAKLRLSPEDYAKFGPVFAWAQREAEGVKGLAALERFVEGRRRSQARQSLPPSPIQNLRHSIADLERKYAAAQAGFESAFEELIKTTGGAGAGALEARAGEMSQALDLLEKLDQAPATLDTLGSLKPKPFGGLERRIVTAAAAITGNAPPASQKEDSLKLLNDLHQLARLTADLNAVPTGELSGPVDTKYAGGRVAALEAKWKSLATELASAAAGGGEIDAAKLVRLATARSIYDALRQGAAVEASVGTAALLYRWVDWRMAGEDLVVIFQPYQDTLAAAVGAYVSDAPRPLEEWSKIEKRYRPLVNLVTRARGFVQDVHALPTGLHGTAAALTTACDNAPFASERHVSFVVAVCRARLAVGDGPGASEALELLLKRLNNE